MAAPTWKQIAQDFDAQLMAAYGRILKLEGREGDQERLVDLIGELSAEANGQAGGKRRRIVSAVAAPGPLPAPATVTLGRHPHRSGIDAPRQPTRPALRLTGHELSGRWAAGRSWSGSRHTTSAPGS